MASGKWLDIAPQSFDEGRAWEVGGGEKLALCILQLQYLPVPAPQPGTSHFRPPPVLAPSRSRPPRRDHGWAPRSPRRAPLGTVAPRPRPSSTASAAAAAPGPVAAASTASHSTNANLDDGRGWGRVPLPPQRVAPRSPTACPCPRSTPPARWAQVYLHGWKSGPFARLLEETYDSIGLIPEGRFWRSQAVALM